MLKWLTKNHQALTAVGAMMVAIAALFVAWDQARVMRSQQNADVWPALQAETFSFLGDDGLTAGLRARNAGVGPAMVRQVAIIRDDGLVAESQAHFNSHFPEPTGFGNQLLTGRILAAGDSSSVLTLIWVRRDLTPETRAEIAEELNRWSLTTCYCSVLGDCWMTVSRDFSEPEPVRRCEIPEARQF